MGYKVIQCSFPWCKFIELMEGVSCVQLGGLEALQADADKLRQAVEFAAACGAFTTTRPGAISAQPSIEEAEQLLKTASFAVAPSA